MDPNDGAVRTLDRILNGKSLAVVGASSNPHKFGYMTLNSIIEGGYEGEIFPVNPKADEILGLKTYENISEIPEKLDTVVVLVRADLVPGVLRESAAKGAAGAVVCSGGFREVGRNDLEVEVKSICEETGLRVIGPNIAGVNYLPNKMCAMFFPVITTRGPVALISQSGTITNALSEWAANEGLGISAAVNLGNQVDLCESDFLDYFALDKNTASIALYVEGVEDGPRFLSVLSRTARQKPVVILKAGRTAAGRRSASSHTGAMAADHAVFDAACRQCGAIVAGNLEELYDYAKALGTMRAPRGNRVFSVSSSGGAGVLAADAVDACGLIMPEPPEELIREFEGLGLSDLATLSNPFDTGADFDADHIREVALLVDKADVADVIFINLGDPIQGAPEMVADLEKRISASLVVGYFGGGEVEALGRRQMHHAGFPVFPVPHRAIQGIGAAVGHARFQGAHARPGGEESVLGRGRTPRPMGGKRAFIPESEAVRYLQEYGIPYPAHGLAHEEGKAIEIAERLGYPVVLKVVSAEIPHKSDVGGVVVGVGDSDTLIEAYRRICRDATESVPGATVDGVLVCKQEKEGLEVIVGAIRDDVFGPTVLFGLGGVYTEVLRDVSFRVAPLQRLDAEEMIREIRGYPILAGARGRTGYDIERLTELLLSVSQFALDHREIEELDLNPIRLFEDGLAALDVRIFSTIGAG